MLISQPWDQWNLSIMGIDPSRMSVRMVDVSRFLCVSRTRHLTCVFTCTWATAGDRHQITLPNRTAQNCPIIGLSLHPARLPMFTRQRHPVTWSAVSPNHRTRSLSLTEKRADRFQSRSPREPHRHTARAVAFVVSKHWLGLIRC